MTNQLEVIVKQSGLETTKAQYILKNFQDYFKIASEWEVKAKAIKVTDASQVGDMAMARTGRLFLREKRIAIEKSRKSLKEQALREGKAIDGIANVLKALIEPIEEYLDKQERFVEIQEEEKRETMRLEVEKRIEEERIEEERLTKLADERRMKALSYSEFWTADYNFRIMSETNFNSVMEDLKKRKLEYNKEQEKQRLENERLKKEAIEREKNAEAERKKQEAKLAKEKAKRETEMKALEEKRQKAMAERKAIEKKALKEREKAEADLRKAEEKARKEREEAEVKAEAERKEKEKIKAQLIEAEKDTIKCPHCKKTFSIKEAKSGKR